MTTNIMLANRFNKTKMTLILAVGDHIPSCALYTLTNTVSRAMPDWKTPGLVINVSSLFYEKEKTTRVKIFLETQT